MTNDESGIHGVGLPGADFVFTADVTGLQTLIDFHRDGQDLSTMAGWAWHEFPNPENYTLADCTAQHPDDGETRPYSPMNPPANLPGEKKERWQKAAAWLRSNSQRLCLGRIGFVRADGTAIFPGDLTHIRQEMDPWSGILRSRFPLDGSEVSVTTLPVSGPDGVAARIESFLLESGKLALALGFPGPSGEWGGTANEAKPEAHRSELTAQEVNHAALARTMDAARYSASLAWTGEAVSEKSGAHRFLLKPRGTKSIDLRLSFSPEEQLSNKPSFEADAVACAKQWNAIWKRGGAVDFSGSPDPGKGTGTPRGALPLPHRNPLRGTESAAGNRQRAQLVVRQIWQQPHPIYLLELVRRAKPGKETMQRHRDVIFATADFMASFPRRGADGKLHLVPPLLPAQECYKQAETRDPAYELAYFHWALGRRGNGARNFGEAPDAARESVWKDLAPLPVVEDRYATVSGPPFTLYHDHPCVLMICGWLPPAADFDMKRFGRTFDDNAAKWEWSTTWGWDPPVLAMAAARLDRPSDAVNELPRASPKNGYLANGHNYLDVRLPLYLPGNGGL